MIFLFSPSVWPFLDLSRITPTLAQQERETIKSRQAEGIAVAKAKGKHLGRPQMKISALSKEQQRILKAHYSRWKSKEMTGVEFATLLGLKKSSFYKIIKEHEAKLA